MEGFLKALRVNSNIVHVIVNKGTRETFRVITQKEIKISKQWNETKRRPKA